jgi:hypothetical protein
MDTRQALHGIARKQRLLLDRISRAEELADQIACDLADLERLLSVDPAGRRPHVRPKRVRELAGASMNARVSEVLIKRRDDDWGLVSLDGVTEFALPPMLTDLLAILCADAEPSADDLVAWKTLDEVAKRLGKKIGRPFSRHAVTQHVYRLRRELFARGGANPLLVQTNRRRGVRMALRRSSQALSA